MTIELKMLVWSAALAIAQMLITLLAAIGQVGFVPLMGNRENIPRLDGWAGRAQRAYRNMLENLLIFAVLILAAQLSGKGSPATALGAQLFFWARLIYAPIYMSGVPWLRTVVWGVSFVGLMKIIAQLL
jgi:uncharacterized MAPEG superfamily protein